MGTATTMNSLAEALGMSLPGSAAIPAPHKERAKNAYLSGKQIVKMVYNDLTPSKILTENSFKNAIVVNSAIGGSTNAPIHLNAIAKHIGVNLNNDDWENYGFKIPLLVNLQPAGDYLGEDFYRAGGVPAVVSELISAGKIIKNTLTVNMKSLFENCKSSKPLDTNVIKKYKNPILKNSGFLNLKGNLFDSAIMKTSVISEDFRKRYLSKNNSWVGRAIVFEGPEDYHKRIDDKKLNIDENCILFIRGVGPIGFPGAAEVVNMQPPAKLLKKGISSLPCIGDGRQSGTSGSPSILNASPEAANLGGLSILKTNDRVEINLNKRSANILIDEQEIRERYESLTKKGGFKIPKSQTPWQEIQRSMVDDLSEGMVLKGAVKYQKIIKTNGTPRDSH